MEVIVASGSVLPATVWVSWQAVSLSMAVWRAKISDQRALHCPAEHCSFLAMKVQLGRNLALVFTSTSCSSCQGSQESQIACSSSSRLDRRPSGSSQGLDLALALAG